METNASIDIERHLHNQIIQDLSQNLQLPVERVSVTYERELAVLGETANVRSYLPILVRRRVKTILAF